MNCFVGIILGLMVSAHAEEADFGKFKAERLANLDERIQKMQEHRGCINSAQDKEALKACRGQMKEWRMDEKEERMGKRKDRMEKRMKKMEEKNKD